MQLQQDKLAEKVHTINLAVSIIANLSAEIETRRRSRRREDQSSPAGAN